MAARERDERRTRWLLGGAGIGAFAVLMTLEFVLEADGITFAKVLLEILEFALTLVAIGGIVLLFQRFHRNQDERLELMRDLEMAREEGEVWRSQSRSYVEGLAAAIETKFESWTMTDAEREVGLLMLKGFSHKEIAALRGTTEATVRQQARAIYQKAGLPGRAAFSAYFLEDLLPTTNERGTKGPQQFT
ncbi:MAG: helix-turn-helix transcriptional regulator [Gammaproteobacteria bacterium]